MRYIQNIMMVFSFLAALLLGACETGLKNVNHEDQVMITLGIDLQEGFEGDLTVIDINGKEFFRKEKVLTKLLLGYAETFVLQVPPGKTTIKISLPQKRQNKTIELDLKENTYLGISLNLSGPEVVISNKPFFYQ